MERPLQFRSQLAEPAIRPIQLGDVFKHPEGHLLWVVDAGNPIRCLVLEHVPDEDDAVIAQCFNNTGYLRRWIIKGNVKYRAEKIKTFVRYVEQFYVVSQQQRS